MHGGLIKGLIHTTEKHTQLLFPLHFSRADRLSHTGSLFAVFSLCKEEEYTLGLNFFSIKVKKIRLSESKNLQKDCASSL